jgi:ABC-type sugar transport system ATPase subunit
MSVTPPLLEIKGLTKSYPGVRALSDVSLTLACGEVLALLGENGAGKSTLIKTLGGVHQSDSGSFIVDGDRVMIANPRDARRLGISVIYQEFTLIPTLKVRENIFLGHERQWLKPISQKTERKRAMALLKRIGSEIDPDKLCGELSVADQQIVEIAKALALNTQIMVMDEPSAALSPREAEGLFAIVEELRSQGIGIIYITHRLNEVEQLADRIMILRDGEHITTQPAVDLSRDQIIENMVGRSLEEEYPPRRSVVGKPRLQVDRLTRGTDVKNVTFTVHRGEVLGIAGLVGAGRTEVARMLFAADTPDTGTITLDGVVLNLNSPRQAIAAGICLLTEDRKSQGLILTQSTQHNFGLPNLADFSSKGMLVHRREQNRFQHYCDALNIRISDAQQRAETLSGGNQQKVVLAKWLQSNAEVIIFDEPTRGIDVGARYEIYQLLNELSEQGKAIIMISSDLPEVLAMSDRIVVMREGQLMGVLDNSSSTQKVTPEDIMRYATSAQSLEQPMAVQS